MSLKNHLVLVFFSPFFVTALATARPNTDFTINSNEKNYQKEYYENGQLQAEGWSIGNEKLDYWYFYHPNGEIENLFRIAFCLVSLLFQAVLSKSKIA